MSRSRFLQVDRETTGTFEFDTVHGLLNKSHTKVESVLILEMNLPDGQEARMTVDTGVDVQFEPFRPE